MDDKTIQLNNVAFTYAGEQSSVLPHVSFYFRRGCINLLLGPSGSGKSTLLHILAGVIPRSIEGKLEGKIILDGENILESDPRRRAGRICMVFQDPESQFFTFKVEDELAFGLENLCLPPAEIRQRISSALSLVGMESYAQARLDRLSGGQKQKIAIAIALAMDPEIIVLDEPTANLDPQGTVEVFAILKKLCQEEDKTIILVEHKLEHLLEKTGHIVVLDQNGAVQLCGDTCPVLAALVFDPRYGGRQLFLSQSLLLLRDLLQDPAAPGEAEAFAERARERLAVLSPAQLRAFICQTWQEFFALLGRPRRQPPAKIAPSPPLLETKRLSFSFGRGRESCDILRGVEMTIRQGDFCAIVGPNGAGKTTLLNLIFRALEGYQGSILLGNRDILKMKKRDLYQHMGLVFQNPEWQFVANAVRQELEFSLRGKKLAREEAEKQVRQVMAQFGFSDPEKSPYLLSQGQKRRLSVAAMLLTGQKLLFLDEPTYGQDYANQQQLMQMMLELNRQGVTVVVVTHDLSLVADYASRVLLLLEGRIAFDGPPAELFANEELLKRAALTCPEIYELTRSLPGVPHYFSGRELTRDMRAVFVQGGLADVSL